MRCPSAIPATMQRATQTVSYRSKVDLGPQPPTSGRRQDGSAVPEQPSPQSRIRDISGGIDGTSGRQFCGREPLPEPSAPARDAHTHSLRVMRHGGTFGVNGCGAYAASLSSRAFSKRHRNCGSGARHMVRYVFRKGSQNFSATHWHYLRVHHPSNALP